RRAERPQHRRVTRLQPMAGQGMPTLEPEPQHHVTPSLLFTSGERERGERQSSGEPLRPWAVHTLCPLLLPRRIELATPPAEQLLEVSDVGGRRSDHRFVYPGSPAAEPACATWQDWSSSSGRDLGPWHPLD